MVVLSGCLRRRRRVLTSQCCNLGRERTKGAVPGIIRRLGESGSHIVPLRALSVGDTGDQAEAHLVSSRGSPVTDSPLLSSCAVLSRLVLKDCLSDGNCEIHSTGLLKG